MLLDCLHGFFMPQNLNRIRISGLGGQGLRPGVVLAPLVGDQNANVRGRIDSSFSDVPL